MWRAPDAKETLYLPLFRYAYAEELHLVYHGHITSKWGTFVSSLFQTQQGFMGHRPMSTSNIRRRYGARYEASVVRLNLRESTNSNLESNYVKAGVMLSTLLLLRHELFNWVKRG